MRGEMERMTLLVKSDDAASSELSAELIMAEINALKKSVSKIGCILPSARIAMRGRTYFKVVIWFREVQVLEYEIAELVRVMLAGVDECVGDGVCDAGTDERREFDDFRAGAEDEYNFILHFE